MEKVWFKLRQTDYPPPTVESMGTNRETGPICLGHFIPDLKRIDFVLNRHQLEEFPDNMPVYPTTVLKFKWESSKDFKAGGAVGDTTPIATALGLNIGARLQLLFKSKITNYEEYERLDRYIVQVSKSYVADCVATIPSLAEHTKNRNWTMFVISGLMIARGATKIDVSESRGVEAQGGCQVQLPAIAPVSATRTKEQGMKSAGASDFVFAVRLARVHKGILQTDWSLDPFSKKATFTTKGEKIDVSAVLSSEGLDGFTLVEDENSEYCFVIGSQDSPQTGGALPENV